MLGGEQRHQVVELEHEADIASTPLRQFARVEGIDVPVGNTQLTLIRAIDAADEIQQSCLARARRAHEREEFPLHDFQIEAVQHLHPLFAAYIAFHDAF